jgi:hypothetical protein
VGVSESRLQMRGSKSKAVSGSIWCVFGCISSLNGSRSLVCHQFLCLLEYPL